MCRRFWHIAVVSQAVDAAVAPSDRGNSVRPELDLKSAQERYLLLHNAEVARRDAELKAQLEGQGYAIPAGKRVTVDAVSKVQKVLIRRCTPETPNFDPARFDDQTLEAADVEADASQEPWDLRTSWKPAPGYARVNTRARVKIILTRWPAVLAALTVRWPCSLPMIRTDVQATKADAPYQPEIFSEMEPAKSETISALQVRLSPGADVGTGEPSPGADVGTGEPSPGADVGTGEPGPGAGRARFRS